MGSLVCFLLRFCPLVLSGHHSHGMYTIYSFVVKITRIYILIRYQGPTDRLGVTAIFSVGRRAIWAGTVYSFIYLFVGLTGPIDTVLVQSNF